MGLPEDWDAINWNQGVIVLPNITEGVPTIAIPKHKYPQYPRGYFMMAYKDSRGTLAVGYNGLEVGDAGKLMSEFVFWHELGHHRLNHTGGLPPDQMEVAFSANKELDADQYSCQHWLDRGDAYGLAVVRRAIEYFAKSTDQGDNEHPASAIRGAKLKQQLTAAQVFQFTIRNDDHTKVDFVLEVLGQCFNMPPRSAQQFVADIERSGWATILSQGIGRTAPLIGQKEAAKIKNFVEAKKGFAGQPAFDMTCEQITG